MTDTLNGETRGRPRIRDDEQILDAALRAFSDNGFDGMSLRSLNRELGLSHGAINQRFGSKEKLFYAAIDHGFGGLIDEVNTVVDADLGDQGDVPLIREAIRSFLLGSARRPELVRLMNREGLHQTEHLDYIWDNHLGPQFEVMAERLAELTAAGTFQPISGRALFFLFTHGAAAPYALTALSSRFDSQDGPLDTEAHAELMADVIISGLLAK